MRLVFIHGRAQQGRDPAMLERSWTGGFQRGCESARLAFPQGLQVVFPFYGDTLDELVRELDAPLIEDVKTRGAAPDTGEAAFRGEMLEEIAELAGVTDQEIGAHYQGEAHEKGPLNWEWVHSLLTAIEGTRAGTKLLDLITRDVYVYLTNSAVRRRIDTLVADAIPDEPCVVVAHSLGTIIAYNVLRDRAEGKKIKRFVTIGSPLGLKSIRKHLAVPLRHPTPVKHWYNAMDEKDVVALRLLDANTFPIDPLIENERVRNTTTEGDFHDIAGYLGVGSVSRRIHEALLAP